MLIHGREIGFAFTVGASAEVAKMCPNNDITRIGEVLGADFVKNVEISTALILLLNDGYVGIEKLMGREAERITRDEILLLTPAELNAVVAHIMHTMAGDSHREVEATPKNEGAEA